MFAKNINTPDQTKKMTDELQDASYIPLFMAVDEEGGQVSRVASNPKMKMTVYPSAQEVGRTYNNKKIAQMEALEIDDEQFDELIKLLQIEYDKEERGIRLLELDDAYQLCTKTEYYGSLIRIVNHPKKPRLTDVMLETLSIIAYKQPVTKQEIEAIRGVKCDHPINKLLEYRLIKEAGRLDAIGRPILFRTTEEFLRCFGVKSTDDLPVVGEEQVEDFKIQAQEEVKYTLDETSLEEEMEEM